MKKMKIIFPVLLMIFMISCGNFGKDKTVICEKIQYDVLINNPDSGHYWWVNNIEGSNREPFIENILNLAFSGKIQTYDYFNNPLTINQLNSISADTLFRTLRRTYPPYELYDTVTINKMDFSDISRIRFLEKWEYDKDNLLIKKEVIGIAPVIARNDSEGNLIAVQPLFWIYFDEKYPNNKVTSD